MAIYIFIDNIIKNKKIELFNEGNMERDFTYIDDVIEGVRKSIDKNYQCEVFNIGSGKKVKLTYLLRLIEDCLNKKADIKYTKMQLGDVQSTIADISHPKNKLGYAPKHSVEEGVPKFIEWYLAYKKNNKSH